MQNFEDSIKKLKQKRGIHQANQEKERISTPNQPVREFRAFTESDIVSFQSKDNFMNNLR